MKFFLTALASVAAVSGMALESDAALALSMPCPGSSAWVHASCEQTATIDASCSTVLGEITARVKGQSTGDWHDPHNKGIYTIESSTTSSIELKRVTGDGKYTDKMTVTLAADGDKCSLQGCSESQVTSVADFSTNFCNVRMLYCGEADGCKPVTGDFTSTVGKVSPSMGAGSSISDCLKV